MTPTIRASGFGLAVVLLGCGASSGSAPDAAATTCNLRDNNLDPPTLTVPAVPFAATFTIDCDGYSGGAYSLDFGDGTTATGSATGCPGAASCTVAHTYTETGVLFAELSTPELFVNGDGQTVPVEVALGGSELALGATGAVPAIATVLPSHGPVGSTVQLAGSGFIAIDELISVDGVAMFSNNQDFSLVIPTSDSALSFAFPSGYGENEQFIPFQPGPHLVAVTNATGTSTTVTFTVDAAP